MTKLQFYLSQGPRIFLAGHKARRADKRFYGSAKEICEQVVESCWNKRFYQTSSQNFTQFWTRDFGWTVKSLLELGHKEEVHKTLRYALNHFQAAGKITTTLTPKGKAFDFPNYAVDSLPWLIHAILLSRFPYENYVSLLNKEIRRFYESVVNPTTGLVRQDKHFSSIKDFAIRKSSCYDNCMLAVLVQDLHLINKKYPQLINPFPNRPSWYKEQIVKQFFNGEFFYDDMTRQEYLASDANLFPILFGFYTNEEGIKKIIERIKSEELDQPVPLVYSKAAQVKFIPQEFFLKNYEAQTAWTHLGLLWMKVLQKYDPVLAQKYKSKYEQLIESMGGFPEVLNPDGTPFKTPFYYCDLSMIWAANFLTL